MKCIECNFFHVDLTSGNKCQFHGIHVASTDESCDMFEEIDEEAREHELNK